MKKIVFASDLHGDVYKYVKLRDFALSNNIIFDSTNVSQFNLSGGSVHCLTNELF